MASSIDIFLLILAGCIGGYISGLLGVGGGIIFVPILDHFLSAQGVEGNDLVLYTLANSFLCIIFAGITGSLGAIREKSINYLHLFSVAFSAIASVLLTTFLIKSGSWYSPDIFKLVFCALLIFTLIKTLMHIEVTALEEKMNLKMGVFIGILTGFVSGLSGLGGGMIMIPLFMMLGNLSIKKASVLSLAIIPVIALPNVLFYATSTPEHSIPGTTGYLAWLLVIPIIIGVVSTVKLGLITAKILSAKSIKIIFACFIVLTVIKTLLSVFI